MGTRTNERSRPVLQVCWAARRMTRTNRELAVVCDQQWSSSKDNFLRTFNELFCGPVLRAKKYRCDIYIYIYITSTSNARGDSCWTESCNGPTARKRGVGSSDVGAFTSNARGDSCWTESCNGPTARKRG